MKRLFEIIHNQGTTLFVVTQDPILTECENARIVHLEPSVVRTDLSELYDPKPGNIMDRTEHFIEEKAPDWVKNLTIGRLSDETDFWEE